MTSCTGRFRWAVGYGWLWHPSGHGGAEGTKDHHGARGVGGAPKGLRLRHLEDHGVDEQHLDAMAASSCLLSPRAMKTCGH